MPELYIGLLHVRGAYVYGAARADGVLAALAAMADCDDSLELLGVEWLQTYDELPERGRESEPVVGVLETLGEDDAALDWAFTYPEDAEPDPADVLKDQVDGFVERWIDGAVERFGEFDFGDYAFVAEMKLDGETEIGWAYQGSLLRATELFERAAEDARDGGLDGGDG
jgi:hypothetical protein